MDSTRPFESVAEGRNLVLNKLKYAFICHDAIWVAEDELNSTIQHKLCHNIQTILLPQFQVKYSAFVSKKSQLSKFFNYA